jgi:hypothetical protein
MDRIAEKSDEKVAKQVGQNEEEILAQCKDEITRRIDEQTEEEVAERVFPREKEIRARPWCGTRIECRCDRGRKESLNANIATTQNSG